jgi:hypothetical protein
VWWLASAVHRVQLQANRSGTACTDQQDLSLPLRQRQAGGRYMFAMNLRQNGAVAPQLLMQLLKAVMLLPPDEVRARGVVQPASCPGGGGVRACAMSSREQMS